MSAVEYGRVREEDGGGAHSAQAGKAAQKEKGKQEGGGEEGRRYEKEGGAHSYPIEEGAAQPAEGRKEAQKEVETRGRWRGRKEAEKGGATLQERRRGKEGRAPKAYF